jgi:hypothetical protein
MLDRIIEWLSIGKSVDPDDCDHEYSAWGKWKTRLEGFNVIDDDTEQTIIATRRRRCVMCGWYEHEKEVIAYFTTITRDGIPMLIDMNPMLYDFDDQEDTSTSTESTE